MTITQLNENRVHVCYIDYYQHLAQNRSLMFEHKISCIKQYKNIRELYPQN